MVEERGNEGRRGATEKRGRRERTRLGAKEEEQRREEEWREAKNLEKMAIGKGGRKRQV